MTYSKFPLLKKRKSENITLDKLNKNGFRKSPESTGRGIIIVEKDNITPAPNVVSWALSEDGYKEMKTISSYNQSATGTAITLRGIS